MHYKKTLTSLFLIVATFAVFWQVGSHQFVNYDDGKYITENPHVKAGLNLESIVWAFTATYVSNWHPLTWLSHMLDVQLFGLHPGAHHVVNVLFHATNTVLLFLTLLRITGAYWQSALVGALFALHPLHVESVAWVAERKDVLSGFFWMLTLMLYSQYVKRPGSLRYLLTLCAFTLGLMSKPMLVTMPFVLLLMDYWPLGRLTSGLTRPQAPQGFKPENKKSLLFSLMLEKVPFFALSVASSIVTIYAQHKGGAVASIKAVSFSFRAVNALWAYVFYIGKMIWPVHLAVIYPLPPTLTVLQGLLAGLIMTGISVITIRTAQRHPYFLVGWLWYIVTLIPVIGLVQVGSQSMADRYTYIPLVGLFIMIAWGIQIIAGDSLYRRIALSVISGFILLAFAVCTWLQLGYWKDSISLFSHASKAVDNNYIANESLGYALAQKGRLDEAISRYSEALRVFPEYERALTGMGNVLVKQDKIKEAIYYTNKALLIDPDSADAHFNMGFALMKQGKDNEALYHYFEGLRSDPDNAEIHHIIGVIFGSEGKLDESIKHFSEALRINPDLKEARVGLETALQLKQKGSVR